MIDLKLLKTFLVVVNHGSFVMAARQLHVVPSVIAKRIAALESLLHTRLFERTTRKVALTAAGERLRQRASELLDTADALMADMGHGADMSAPAHLRVLAPTTLTTLHLSHALTEFLKLHPHLSLQVELGDRSINPIEESFDVVVSGRLASYEGVQQFPLAPIDYVLCASPAQAKALRTLAHPSELSALPCLVFEPLGTSWVFQSARGAVHVEVKPRLIADDNHTVLQACLKGLGVAVLPGYLARPQLQRGRLRALLPNFPLQEAWFKAYIPRRKVHLPHVMALKEFLSVQLGQLHGDRA